MNRDKYVLSRGWEAVFHRGYQIIGNTKYYKDIHNEIIIYYKLGYILVHNALYQ